MKKTIAICVAVYIVLLASVLALLPFPSAFRNGNSLLLQVTREGGIPYSVMEALSEDISVDYFEYAFYLDLPGRVLYDGEATDSTIRVWKEFVCDKRGTEITYFEKRQVPPFGESAGIFVYPAVLHVDSPSFAEITAGGETFTLDAVYEVARVPWLGDIQIDFYAEADHAGLIEDTVSLTFLQDDPILALYNVKHGTDLKSAENLSYDGLLIRITSSHIPTQRELHRIITSLENKGYTVYRPIMQSEITWRTTRIFFFSALTLLLVGTVAVIAVREKHKKTA